MLANEGKKKVLPTYYTIQFFDVSGWINFHLKFFP